MQENIIGYLLGALDEVEMAQFEAELDRNVDLQVRVQDAARSLQVLENDYDSEDDAPPIGLVESTCLKVANATVSVGRRKTSRKKRAASRSRELGYDAEAWSMIDVVVAASVFFVACLLFFPAIKNSRFHAEIAGCQDNLIHVGRALIEYSGHDPQGEFPKIPKSGPLGVAGMYAPTLLEHGLITESHQFFCASTSSYRSNVDLSIPSISEIAATSPGPARAAIQERMGGSYGFVLGIKEGDQVGGIRNRGRDNFALMTDTPVCEIMPLKRELKRHCNVLFECGNVRVLPLNTQSWQGDRLYENDNGQISAGVHEDDAVIGASATKPLATE